MLGADVTITVPGGASGLPAYAAVPPGAARGVVVLHEILGRQPEIDRVVERFAARGYAAIAPDLFATGGRLRCIYALMRASMSGEGPAVQQVYAARAWLCARANLTPAQVGLIGFCITGGFVLAMGKGWPAVSTNYGGVPRDDTLRGLGPVIGCYGGRDRAFGQVGAVLERRLAAHGVTSETHTYPDVGHSFLTDGDHPFLKRLTMPILAPHYDPRIAEAAWGHIFAFFARHIPTSAP